MVIFRLYISPCCDLDIEQNEPIFLHDTLWLMRLHYHNRFGNKIFCGSDNTVGTVFTDILNLHCDLDLECSNPILPQNTPAYDAVPSNQVWLQTDQQFKRYSKNSHILII